MEAKDISFDYIKVGDNFSFNRTWEDKDIVDFSILSGDKNPLHLDEKYAETTSFKRRIVHGMLVSSLFSTFVGMYLPGKRCLYLKQSISFKKPVFIGDTVTAYGVVLSKSESTKILTLSTIIKKEEEIVIEGEAQVQVI